MAITKASIQQLIMAGKLSEAVDSFMQVAKGEDDDIENTLILQMSRINTMSREENNGLVTSATATMNKNKITNALLSILNDFYDEYGDNLTPRRDNDGHVKKILFLGVNTGANIQLRIDQEVNKIDAGLRRSLHRDKFELITKLAVTVTDLRRYLLEESPHIIHFSGHGQGEEGLVFDNGNGQAKLVASDAIAGLFSLFSDSIECVILNACYSTDQADAIIKYIPYVIGMNKEMADDASTEFSVAFYDGLGAGKDIDFAFRLGKSAIMMKGLSGNNIPQLLKKI